MGNERKEARTMINKVILKNFGPFTQVDWNGLGAINLVIGGNGSGKTFLLKALYSAVRTLEEYKRGDEPRSAAVILADKLYWIFQTEKIGDLVRKDAKASLFFSITLNGKEFFYKFGKKKIKEISSIENHVDPRKDNSIFFPAKEVLSLHDIILESCEVDKDFGFDHTYYDLARALRQSPTKGRNYPEFANSRKILKEIIGGKVEFDDASKRWQFKQNNHKFSIGVTAEGVKKIAILDTLLGNRYLLPGSIVFIDEPESALHPSAISKFLNIVALLAKSDIQFFLASHSYFVIKKLYLIAQEEKISIPVLSENKGEWTCADLKDGMPDNPIIDESIQLYKEEVELALK